MYIKGVGFDRYTVSLRYYFLSSKYFGAHHGSFHAKIRTMNTKHDQLQWHFTPPISFRAWNRKHRFPNWKCLNGLSKSLAANVFHPTETNPVQINQVVQKSFAQDDRRGLHADTVCKPSFHVLWWLTSNSWHIHYIPACWAQIALKWWQLQDSQRGIWAFWQQVAFHLYWES